VDNTKELRLLSLCSGYGGIERGLELAGVEFRTVAHVEIEAFAIANLVAKMETGQMAPAPIWTNLKTLPLEPFRDGVDILTGGYPCQPFSTAGKRLGAEDPRHLWPYILNIIDEVMPKMCFFENVEGHISKGLREVLIDLESWGYETTWGIFSAEEVGAPHQRKRVFILAHSKHNLLQGREKQAEKGENFRADSEKQLSRSDNDNHWEEIPQPQICGVDDGPENRSDRLRLLGNGVVPQTAAIAWTELSKRKD